MTADKDRYRTLTAAAVLLVAAIAAALSFVHIESLATRYGQTAGAVLRNGDTSMTDLVVPPPDDHEVPDMLAAVRDASYEIELDDRPCPAAPVYVDVANPGR